MFLMNKGAVPDTGFPLKAQMYHLQKKVSQDCYLFPENSS
jgi:hypothetical protein